MKSTAHFFGDSFTCGHTLYKNSSIWPRLIAKGLDLKYKNYAQGGASPQFIINQVIKALPNIKEGDKVFLLETVPDRIEVYNEYKDEIVSVTNGKLVDALEFGVPFDKNYFNNQDEIKSIFNFIYDHRYKKLNPFGKYFSSIFSDFGIFFKSIKVEYIHLPYKLSFANIQKGEMFETSRVASNGSTADDHFSIKGHWQFAKFISKNYFNSSIKLPEEPKKGYNII